MKSSKKIYPAILIVGWLLTWLLASTAQADVGPALSGITAHADNASTVFWSPAGITRLDQPELLTQATLVAMESKFNVKESNRDGGLPGRIKGSFDYNHAVILDMQIIKNSDPDFPSC